MLFHGPRFYFRCMVGAQHKCVPNFSCPAIHFCTWEFKREVADGD